MKNVFPEAKPRSLIQGKSLAICSGNKEFFHIPILLLLINGYLLQIYKMMIPFPYVTYHEDPH